MIKLKLFIVVLIASAFLLNACREEIIPPNNPAGNINEPIQDVTDGRAYSFSINAENFTLPLTGLTRIEAYKTSLYFNLSGYKAGYVSINIYNKENRLVYTKFLNLDNQEISAQIVGETPHSIEMDFREFSGKLKVQLARVQ